MPLAYHEPYDELKPKTREIHRALESLIEELEAVDWYLARADTTTDPELKKALEHNMNEEVEHAALMLEWLRRNMPRFDQELRTYLFTSAPITEIEEQAEGHAEAEPNSGGSGLKLGSLR